MTAKKAATSAKHKTATKKHAASAKHTETKAQLAHLHVLHVEHEAHLAHLKAIGQKVTTKAKPATHAKAAKKVSFGIGDHLPVCGFEAVAQSLRVLGQPVHGDDVAGLWELCGAPEAVTIEDALAAAALFGLGGYRPAALPVGAYFDRGGERQHGRQREGVPVPPLVVVDEYPWHGDQHHQAEAQQLLLAHPVERVAHGLILRIDVPGPHAVLATRDGWWSWGELYDPWRCNVLEAWAVAW